MLYLLYYERCEPVHAHVSAILVAILREVSCIGYITKSLRTNAQI
jgi:hypothetical protein